MDERTTGIILRTRPLTETSLIVHWLTADLGRVATVAKGARRPKSPFRGKLDLFYRAEFSFARSARSDLHNLREVKLLETHPALRGDIGYLQQAAYCAALVEQTTETETPLPEIYELVSTFMMHLTSRTPQPLTVFALEMKLLSCLGLEPDFADVKLTSGARMLLQRCSELNWTELGTLKLSDAQANEMKQFLHGFLIYHLERIPSGRNAALGEMG